MHAISGILAIRWKQRRREEQKMARYQASLRKSWSREHDGLSPRPSLPSLDHSFQYRRGRRKLPNGIRPRTMIDSKGTTNGLLHIGVIFIILGVFLLISGLFPNDLAEHHQSQTLSRWVNGLIATGLVMIVIGAALVFMNRSCVKKEERSLELYVEQQLSRSKSGDPHRSAKHDRRAEKSAAEAESGTKSSPTEPQPRNDSGLAESKPSASYSTICSTALLQSKESLNLIPDDLTTVVSSAIYSEETD